jgi:hypothetical protein
MTDPRGTGLDLLDTKITSDGHGRATRWLVTHMQFDGLHCCNDFLMLSLSYRLTDDFAFRFHVSLSIRGQPSLEYSIASEHLRSVLLLFDPLLPTRSEPNPLAEAIQQVFQFRPHSSQEPQAHPSGGVHSTFALPTHEHLNLRAHSDP